MKRNNRCNLYYQKIQKGETEGSTVFLDLKKANDRDPKRVLAFEEKKYTVERQRSGRRVLAPSCLYL